MTEYVLTVLGSSTRAARPARIRFDALVAVDFHMRVHPDSLIDAHALALSLILRCKSHKTHMHVYIHHLIMYT